MMVSSKSNGNEKLQFIVVEARIETRMWMLDTRASSFELPASIPASSPKT